MTIKIILADDHPVLIAGIQHELSAIRTIQVIGTASNALEVLDLLARQHIDILVTDYVMPGGGVIGDGMNMLGYFRRNYPELKIIVFTTLENPGLVSAMLETGVKSVLNKADDIVHLVTAIHTVYGGSSYLSPTIASIFQVYGDTAMVRQQSLSRRELEVVRLYVDGASINEIATRLNRTKQTVSTQKSSAMRKLGLEKDADLFRFAYESGLLDDSVKRISPDS